MRLPWITKGAFLFPRIFLYLSAISDVINIRGKLSGAFKIVC